MRIHLPLHPEHFVVADAGPSAPPLARIGGELVVVELQGELGWDGDKAGGVIGVLGLDRPNQPTLHIGQHHLLHGKMANLPRPYAVIRKVIAASSGNIEGDIAAEESDEEHEAEAAAAEEESTPKKQKLSSNGQSKLEEEDEAEDDVPPFPEAYSTPSRAKLPPASSSPWEMPSSARDYSSDLESSPAPFGGDEGIDDDEEAQKAMEEERRRAQKAEERRKRRRAERPERARHYEVVGVVRKKVVFALRPEPLVQPTPLPE